MIDRVRLNLLAPRCAAAITLFLAMSLTCAAAEPIRMRYAAAIDYDGAMAEVRRVVQEELQRGILTGVSLAVVDEQQVLLAEGFGLADAKQKTPASATTLYRIGSLSKLFTALAVMQLVEQGKLELDAPIGSYLSEFRIAIPFENPSPITLRQLMCHRSGLVRESPVGGYFDGSEATIAQSVASLESCVLANPPNTKTRYSNIGVTVVGDAVAAASGQSFEDYQREHLLRPLGMSRSVWRMTDDLRPGLATGYMRIADGQGGFTHREAPTFELGTIPAGNLYSCAADLAEFAKMILAEGQSSAGRLIQTETLHQMFLPQLTDAKTGFGLGFYVGNLEDHRTVQHSGAVYGFSTSIVVLPEARIAVIVLANEDIVPGPVKKLSEAALRLTLEAKTGTALPAPPEPKPLDRDQLSGLVGHYESPVHWAELQMDDDRLTANIASQPMALTHVGDLKFEAEGPFAHRALFEFRRNNQGDVDEFSAFGQRFRRVDASPEQPIPNAWQRYLGSYGPDYIPLVVSARHGHLYAMTENMVDYRLTPVNQTVFRMPEGLYADEYLVFQVAADGQVHGVNLANMTLPRREEVRR